MIGPFRRRRAPSPSALLDSSRAGMQRALGALPAASVADIFVDLAARTGVDLGEVAERVFDRLGDLAAQAGGQAGTLADTETARQLRDVAARAAGRAAEVAYRTGAERLLEVMPRRRKSHRGLLLLAVAGGLAAGAGIAYLLAQRRAEERRRLQAAAEGPAGVAGETKEGQPPAPVNNLFDGVKQRFALARGEARTARAETERELWRQYAEDVYHGSIPESAVPSLPPMPRES